MTFITVHSFEKAWNSSPFYDNCCKHQIENEKGFYMLRTGPGIG